LVAPITAQAIKNLEFEKAPSPHDEIKELNKILLNIGS
jgi:hypothetical protein